jgi:predicted  nucleic acid-binding Zn-ribbon protein
MDDQLDRLEARVLAAIALIQDLRRENRELAARCGKQEARLDDLRSARERLEGQLAAARDTAAAVDDFEAKKQLIERKIGSLLEKLEAMG